MARCAEERWPFLVDLAYRGKIESEERPVNGRDGSNIFARTPAKPTASRNRFRPFCTYPIASGVFPRFLDISGRRAYRVSRGAPPGGGELFGLPILGVGG